jgi:sugar O-acyltransferase (sialic acid O-acetyltransferase NeuD family)
LATRRRVVIVGAGGFAREVAWLLEQIAQSGSDDLELVGYCDDDPARRGQSIRGVPVVALEDARASLGAEFFTPAIGSPKAREAVVSRAVSARLEPISLVHPRVERSRYVEIGAGAVVCAGCILTTDIVVGRYSQLNLDCTVGHDVVLGEFATLAPGVHVSGNVHLGRRSYVGTGAAIINGTSGEPLVVGEDAVVGAAACVTRDVAPGVTVVGVPAKSRG